MTLRLTQTVQKGGCAAKVAAKELRAILSQVKFPPLNPGVLIDGKDFDDAAIFQVTEEIALVQTLDFFTPIVDTPKVFGQVAAANAISDVYAMGGRPKTAMGILAFPLMQFTNDVIAEVLQGACEVMEEARVSFVGGHSIDDDTLKFGLSVTGLVHPRKIWFNAGARPGDLLILTKPLGTGVLSAALKRSEITEEEMKEAIDSMITVNNVVDYLTEEEILSITSATDITGFGFLGHAFNVATASAVDLEIKMQSISRFSHAEKLLASGFLTKAHRTNREYVENNTDWGDLEEISKLLLLDPQTSGGLFLSVEEKSAQRLLEKIQVRFPRAAIVGQVLSQKEEHPQILCR